MEGETCSELMEIFTGQAGIQANAASDVRVEGATRNTNCLIAMNNARDIPRSMVCHELPRREPGSCSISCQSKPSFPKFPMSRYGEIIPPPSTRIITMRKLAAFLHLKSFQMIPGPMLILFPPFSNAERQSFRHEEHPQPHQQPTRQSIR